MDFPEPLPPWAIGTTDGSLEVGAVLPTRDGRCCGNAVIAGIDGTIGGTNLGPVEIVYMVVTDAGNAFRLNDSEIRRLFYPPKWISSLADHPAIAAHKAQEERGG